MKKLTTVLIAICLLTMLLTASVFAAENQRGDWGSLVWQYDAKTATLTISGQGDMKQGSAVDDYPWHFLSEEIHHVVIEEGVTSLGDYCFRSYRELETADIASTVTYVGEEVFAVCDAMVEVSLKEGLTNIGAGMFLYCGGLERLEIPCTVTEIGDNAFNGTALTALELPPDLVSIGSQAFWANKFETIALPDGLVTIGDCAFYDCWELREITIPASVAEIGEDAFYGCELLRGIYVEDGSADYWSDENGVLYTKDKTQLVKVPVQFEEWVLLPAETETLAVNAIEYTAKLEGVHMAEGNTHFFNDDAGALYSAEELKLLFVPKGVTGAYSPMEGTVVIGEDALRDCKKLTSVVLPDGVEIVEDYAFCYSENLETVILPDTVTHLGAGAFTGCKGLRSVTLPAYLDYLDFYLFNECEKLESAAIPRGVELVQNNAFADCKSLKCVFVPDTVTEISGNAFKNCSALTDVFYEGTREEWEEISVYDGNDWLIYANLHFGAEGIETVTPTPAPTPAPIPKPMDGVHGIYGLQRILVQDSAVTDSYDAVNYKEQAYNRTASPVSSALVYEGGQYMRVQRISDQILVEWYDDEFVLQDYLTVPLELPLYGGVYMGENDNFVVCGQYNREESDSCEVIRVIRYSKTWERQAAVSLYGANTYIPFDAGSLRFVQRGDMLYIHTAHEMYTSRDGLNHQANMTFAVRVSDMTITEEHYKVDSTFGYVSHSFNQFIIADGDDLLTLDHGDAYPRALQLSRYQGTAGKEQFTVKGRYQVPDNLKELEIFKIAANTGHYNYTGVQVGGLEASATHYLVAGASCAQTGGINQGSAQQNIFVTAVDKAAFVPAKTTTAYFTDYGEEDDVYVTAPHLVKVDDNRFCLLWMADETLYYCMLDSAGQRISDVFCADAALSDCKPIVVNGCVTWYVTDWSDDWSAEMHVYRIPLTADAAHSPVITDGVAPTCTDAGLTEGVRCADCGEVIKGVEAIPPTGHSYADGVCTMCGVFEGMENPFTDVTVADWFMKPVMWAVGTGVTGGTSPNTFSPEASCTRGQVVTFLWAAAGKPAPQTTDNPFEDVQASDWYYQPVLWAVEQGITGGTSATTFSPDAPCTRAQVVTFLYAAEGKPSVAGGSGFVDVADTDWFAKPVIWAAQNDVTGGIGDGKFGPDQTCTRAQVVTFLYKVYQK